METLEQRIVESKESKNNTNRSTLIEDYMPFIVKEISKVTGRYVSYENSLELSIGLMAFDEAIGKYENEKGSFTNFASLVIRSRIKDFLKQNTYYKYNLPLEENEEIEDKIDYGQNELSEEVEKFNEMLELFNIDIDLLVEESPKHSKTRRENIDLGRNISKESYIVSKLYKTKKLPMADIILKFRTTKKRLKYHRNFIISVIIVFKEGLSNIREFMNLGGGAND